MQVGVFLLDMALQGLEIDRVIRLLQDADHQKGLDPARRTNVSSPTINQLAACSGCKAELSTNYQLTIVASNKRGFK